MPWKRTLLAFLLGGHPKGHLSDALAHREAELLGEERPLLLVHWKRCFGLMYNQANQLCTKKAL